MANIFTMLAVILLGIILHCYTFQNICGPNCLCFNQLVDCSKKDLKRMPSFRRIIRLSTKKLLLRNMPQLDMSNMDCSEWPNLDEINLRGEYDLVFFANNPIFARAIT